MVPLFVLQCRPTRGRKDAFSAGERRILHPSSVSPLHPRTRLMAAGCNAATCLSRLLCVFHGIGIALWWSLSVARAMPTLILLFAGILPLCMVVVWGCVGGGTVMVLLG
ncbi:hypothetical protein TcCL_Unassigned02396 [Trypanosoma cruzi]|nr:hypothetical protein TcCL_Unassigned02396 [Trypanosoma cruzi]